MKVVKATPTVRKGMLRTVIKLLLTSSVPTGSVGKYLDKNYFSFILSK